MHWPPNTPTCSKRSNDRPAPPPLCVLDGANPFLANSHGETPMELAVLAGAIKLVHIFERHALFVGQVEVQVSCEGQGKIGVGRWMLG